MPGWNECLASCGGEVHCSGVVLMEYLRVLVKMMAGIVKTGVLLLISEVENGWLACGKSKYSGL